MNGPGVVADRDYTIRQTGGAVPYREGAMSRGDDAKVVRIELSSELDEARRTVGLETAASAGVHLP